VSISGQVFFVTLALQGVILPYLSNQSAFDGMHIVGNKKHMLFRNDRRFEWVE
jgi:hypothetical protein